MINRIKYFVCVLLMSCAISFGQQYHVIKLKNGSEIKGQLVDVDSTGARIEVKGGSIFAYERDEIAGIEKFYPKVSGKGVFVRAEAGVAGGSEVSPSFLFSNGYSFNEHWDLGLIVGYESYFGRGYIPFMANGRFNLLNRHFTPFVDVIAGYEMPLSNWNFNKGGISTGARIGITRYFGERFGFSTSLGYRFAHLRELSGWWDDFTTIRQANRFEIKFALTIK